MSPAPAGAVASTRVVLARRAQAAWGRGDQEFRCALPVLAGGQRDLLAAVSSTGWYLTTSETTRIRSLTHDEPITSYVFRRR